MERGKTKRAINSRALFFFGEHNCTINKNNLLSYSILSMSGPPHCPTLIAAAVKFAVSCCAASIIDEKRQE